MNNNKFEYTPWLPCDNPEWTRLQVKRRFTVELGKMLQNVPNDSSDQEVPYLKSIHVQWEKVILDDLPTMWASENDIAALNIQVGDLLVCEGGEVGRAAIMNQQPPENCIIQNALHRVRAVENGDVHFLRYILLHASNQEWFNVLCNRSTIAHFTAEKFKEMWIWVPAYESQRRIAAYLDRETAHIDALIAAKERLLTLLAEKRQALIARAVTSGLDPNVKMKDSGVEWLGEVPEGWDVVKLKYIVSITGGGTPSKSNEEYWQGKIPWVSPKDMKSFFITETEDYISDVALIESSTNLIPSNSLLVVVRSGILRHTIPIGINLIPVALNQDMKALMSSNNRIFIQYLSQIILGFQRLLLPEWVKQGATVESIEMEFFQNTLFPLPSIEEQKAIVSHIQNETTQLDALRSATERTITLLKERRSALIGAAVTGQIEITKS